MLRTVLWRAVMFLGLAVYPTSQTFAQHCNPAWTAAFKCVQHCGPCPNLPGGSGGQAAPSAPAGPSPAELEGRRLNQEGIDAYNAGNYESARDFFQQALDKMPNDATIQSNLQKAKDQIVYQAELKRQKEQQEFERTKRQALGELKGVSNGGDFDSGTGLKGLGSTEPGSKDAPNSSGLKTLPDINTDPMMPTGLPKSVDDSIVAGYAGAPPGVSDRVRKAFQAIAAHDWKVARAWFQDALNNDPTNVGLKRLVDLADFTENRSELIAKPASNVSNKPSTNDEIPANADARTYALTSPKIHTREAWERFIANRYGHPGQLQLPADSDIELLFSPPPKPLELPKDSDIEFLFPGLAADPAMKINEFLADQWVQWVTGPLNDPRLNRISQPPTSQPKKP